MSFIAIKAGQAMPFPSKKEVGLTKKTAQALAQTIWLNKASKLSIKE